MKIVDNKKYWIMLEEPKVLPFPPKRYLVENAFATRQDRQSKKKLSECSSSKLLYLYDCLIRGICTTNVNK